MISFRKMWKNIAICGKNKRNIKEVNYPNIDLNEYLIIDVRSRREFKETHLNGALNIPLAELKNNIATYVKNKNKKILVCCALGIRSEKAVNILETLGYTQVYNLKGGLENI